MDSWKSFISSVSSLPLEDSKSKLEELLQHFKLPSDVTKELSSGGFLLLEGYKTNKNELVNQAIEKFVQLEKPSSSNVKVDLCFALGSLLYGSSQLFQSQQEQEMKLLTYASEFFQKATTIDPKHYLALANLAELFDLMSNKVTDNKQMFYSSKSKEIRKYINSIKKGEENVKLPPSSYTKYLKAQTEKEKGTEFFKQGDMKKAMFHYHCSKNYIKDLYGLPEDKELELKQLNTVLSNNIAVCNIKLNNFSRAIEILDEVLQNEPNNIKALFRRGKSYSQLKNFLQAEQDLEKALQLSPGDKEIIQELKILNQRSASFKKQESQAYSKIFDE
ncbi:Rho GTPase [Tieghemostelium lacteum]|uniref:Rho GTPase n=1 Tax=Tieghemostelium lacteum TaxID=361077 RepID=A0A152A5A6_TIELA|nr:Rho GTPase [Tieghemostelium lacteum]|eukprot:KYR01422.1 Rho GTPase [Tieghemostelium lacteum]